MQDTLDKYRPGLLFTFGVSALEVSLRASGETMPRFPKITKQLGMEFRSRTENFREGAINVVPLLHVSISRGKFLEAHRDFIDGNGQAPPNYFDHVGMALADLLLRHMADRPIWVQQPRIEGDDGGND